MPIGRPETTFLRTDGGAIGYQVFGSGDRDIVFISHWLTNVDAYWDEPSAVRYFDRLASMGRVILIDKRGAGISDPAPGDWPVPLVEDNVDDIRAVLDAVGSERATLIGDTEGGMLAMVLAATHPANFPELVLVNAYARLARSDDYPIGAPERITDGWRTGWVEQHGTTGDILLLTAPSVVDDRRFRAWFVRFQRAAQKQNAARKVIDWLIRTDVRAALPSIQATTLVVHRRDAAYHRIQHGRYVAERIEGARFVELPGGDTLPFHAGPFDEVLDVVEEFLGGETTASVPTRQLATVLFTDIVGSTAMAAEMGDQRWLDLLAEHDRTIEVQVERFRGETIKTTGDGALAAFDGPYRAIQAAQAIRQELADVGLTIRAGLHTGEIERRGGDVGGLAVHLASRVMDSAGAGGIRASGTVRDLVVGSGVVFTACGTFDLKGVPGSWDLFEVT